MTQKIPPYNEYSQCVKCGWRRGPETKLGIEFCIESQASVDGDCTKGFPKEHFGEHLHRGCMRCGYMWIEGTLPADVQERIHQQNVADADPRHFEGG